ncbi:MAG: DUF2335 domain-containing protein [Candidatus Paceibacterota bacterium]
MNTENKQLNNNTNNSAVVRQQMTFSGPLPPPYVLKGYDDIVPGAAKIIIDMAENQSAHRQELEKKVINSDISNSKLGLFFGFAIGLVGIISGTFLVYSGHTPTGFVISFGTIASLVGVFVYGSRGRRREREDKMKN